MTKRRNVLMGVGGIVAIAGCTDELEEPEEEKETQEEPEEEEEETQEEEEPEEEVEIEEEEPEPASIEVIDYDIPNEVQIGVDYTLSLTFENTGDTEGEYTTEWLIRFSDTDWEPVGTYSFELDAGETRTIETEPTSHEYIREVSHRFVEPEIEETTNFVPRRVERSDGYTSPTGIFVTTERPERETSDGNEWAFVEFTATNESGGRESLPSYSDIVLVTGRTQYEPTRPFSAPRDGGEYEGGAVVDGVTRRGWIAYDVGDEFTTSDYEIVWAGSDNSGEWLVELVGPGNV